LFVLIHDDAHCGILGPPKEEKLTGTLQGEKKGSNINQFLGKLNDALEENPNANLIFLGVSATLFVFGVPTLEDIEIVDWAKNWQDPDSPQYCPGYTDIRSLEIDDSFKDTFEKGETKKSARVLEEYREPTEGTIAWKILEDLQEEGEKPKIAFVRFANQEDAKQAAESLREWRKSSTKGNFFIITYINDKNLKQELQEELSSQPGLPEPRALKSSRPKLEDLHDVNALIIAVDKVSMGTTVPPTVRHWDIRGKYTNTPGDSVIQDIGRCAGYGKQPPAKVYASLDLSGLYSKAQPDPVQTPLQDRHLTKNNQPRVSHPEPSEAEGVYSRLKDHMVLLSAQPQMGKTGVITLLLQELLEMASYNRNSHRPPILPMDEPAHPPSPSSHSLLVQQTKRWATLINESREKFYELFVGQSFYGYHQLYAERRTEWGREQPYKDALDSILQAAEFHGNYVLADCGCGEGGLFPLLKARSDYSIEIHGFDTFESARLPKEPNGNHTFTFHHGDMGSGAEELKEKFNGVLYCLSLFENNITRHLQWALKTLKPRGSLYIVDVERRFPDNFGELVSQCGFTEGFKKVDEKRMITTWRFCKKPSCPPAYFPTIQLSPY